LQSGGEGRAKTPKTRASKCKGDVGVIDCGHGREKGGGGEEGVRVEIVGGRRGRDQPHDTRAERAGGGGSEMLHFSLETMAGLTGTVGVQTLLFRALRFIPIAGTRSQRAALCTAQFSC
jgi:hypothetical protein